MFFFGGCVQLFPMVSIPFPYDETLTTRLPKVSVNLEDPILDLKEGDVEGASSTSASMPAVAAIYCTLF